MRGKNALVTGGAGFIGSHLVDRLIAEGYHVRVIDNFSTGRPENLAHLRTESRLHVLEGDIAASDRHPNLYQDLDYVFHLAALADIVPSIEMPTKYHHSNVEGTLAVLEACRKYTIRKFLYSASSSCYGIPDVYPTPETAALRPQYPYALTKCVGEQYVLHWGQVYKLPVISLRLFNVFGPRSRTSGTYGAVFGVFLAQKLNGHPYTVVGDGTQSRDFTLVHDVVDAFFTASQSTVHQEIFNVGSGGHYAVNRLVELLGGPVIHIPKRPGEPDVTFADVSKIQKILNWKAKTPFEAGVKVVLDHIDYWKAAPLWTPEKIQGATKVWFDCLQ